MATKQKHAALGDMIAVGDVVALTWDDTVAYGRTTVSDDRLVLAEFISYGIVSHLDQRKVVIRQEVEVTPRDDIPGEDGEHRSIREPVVIPAGCVTRVKKFHAGSEATVSAPSRRTCAVGHGRRTSRTSRRSRTSM